ncbi:MAG: hypothetical protein CMK09_19150 [Ponticaulis sp.]|nr:hypothetical protein [Ponticaulis sp.]
MGFVDRIEHWLRIPPETPADLLIRYRAIWLLGFLFIAMQVFNMITMSVNYGGWTYDHLVSVGASSFILGVVVSLRWYKNYHVYALLYSLFVIGGISGSALPDGAGINSALLSLFVIGPILNGYISGRVATLLFWAVSCVFLCFLYWVSLSHPPRMVSGDYVLEFNRLTNSIYYLTIATGLSVMLTQQTFSAMVKMRENEERALKAEAAKSEFLAKMSHELRTPLNGVLGLTDALLMGDLSEREKELTSSIRKSGDSLLMILNDILDLSKIEAGKMSVNMEPTLIKPAIEGVFAGWREAAEEKGLEFRTEVSHALDISAYMDELRLRQIMHNLISNAIKFTEAGRVSVMADLRTDLAECNMLSIRVADTGPGIPEADARRIFEVFEQGGLPNAQQAGTGLGLPICKMLTSLLSGSICLEKTGPTGSVFRVELPLKPSPRSDRHNTPPCESLQINPTMKVLVVEDHEINRLVLSEYLAILGLDFEMANDGVECLKKLDESRFDIVLMDKNMPRMNGLEATAAIRKSEQPWAGVPIIALTADAMVGERERLLKAGMDYFVSKPVRMDELAQVLSLASSEIAS